MHFVYLIGGLVLLVVGAEATVRGARSFGIRVGLSPIVVGLSIVAYGTSTPELAVSVAATLEGEPAIALGNVVGSNIGNVFLVLGVCAVIRPIETHARVLRVEAPIVVAGSVLVAGLLAFGMLGRVAGSLLVAALLVYTVLAIRLARRESRDEVAQDTPEHRDVSASPWLDLALAGVGFGLLVVGGATFTRGASDGAAALGLSPAVAGLTIVAIGTSLPEMAASIVATLRGEGDIAVGNIVGSNLFNLFCVLGVSASVAPIPEHTANGRDLGVMLAAAVVLYVALLTGRRLDRWEGVAFLAAYAIYLAALAG